MNILFVCTGNTCRSSMAEGIFKHMLQEKSIENINVSSAGISAFEGDDANEKAIYTLNKKGIDILNHKARQLTNKIIQDADLILTMTKSHKKMITNAMPDYSRKVFTLKEYALLINDEELVGKNLDIDDPYGLDYNVYEKVAEEIEEQLLKIFNNLDKIKEK
ncbi:MAG: low molecular weight protein arginine phosphatase [Sedimentibacter sp.]